MNTDMLEFSIPVSSQAINDFTAYLNNTYDLSEVRLQADTVLASYAHREWWDWFNDRGLDLEDFYAGYDISLNDEGVVDGWKVEFCIPEDFKDEAMLFKLTFA